MSAEQAIVEILKRLGLALPTEDQERSAYELTAIAAAAAFGGALLALGRRFGSRDGEEDVDITALVEQLAPLGAPAFEAVTCEGTGEPEAEAFMTVAHIWLGAAAFELLTRAGMAVIQAADARRLATRAPSLSTGDIREIAGDVADVAMASVSSLENLVAPRMISLLRDHAIDLVDVLRNQRR
jgi:hypothetical protein